MSDSQRPRDYRSRIEGAWLGRVSGCMLGKAVERFSMQAGQPAVAAYLEEVNALPLRDYIPASEAAPPLLLQTCCKDQFDVSMPDDDINYSVLALMLLETHGQDLTTSAVARAWLKHLPLASTYTAERAAYRKLLVDGHEWFAEGSDLGFDIDECADNPYSDWIGAQIRADVYGWVCPGEPERAARFAAIDAQLSHRGEGVYGAVVVAAMGAVLAGGGTLEEAVSQALLQIPQDCDCAGVIRRAQSLAANEAGGAIIRAEYQNLHVVHTVNNLGLVLWSLLRNADDFSAAIGDVVAEGLDTDCNGATVGALWSLQGKPIPKHWLSPWQGAVGVSLAGQSQLTIDALVERTVSVAKALATA
ncbi:MAG: hypothetical protein CMP96_01105 [Gammaproteobacteria bacterium]|nr:hypothetical protein [Gammaproteobacteria bacterium]